MFSSLERLRVMLGCGSKSFKIFNNVWTQRKTPHAVGVALLSLTLADCENTQVKETENLSVQHVLKQSSLLTCNSAATLLTTTTTAILDACQRYKDCLAMLVKLIDENTLTNGGTEEEQDMMVSMRVDMVASKQELIKLQSYLDCAEKLVISTAEFAYLTGADFLCASLTERLQSSKQEIEKLLKEIKDLEESYLIAQKQAVTKGRPAGKN